MGRIHTLILYRGHVQDIGRDEERSRKVRERGALMAAKDGLHANRFAPFAPVLFCRQFVRNQGIV